MDSQTIIFPVFSTVIDQHPKVTPQSIRKAESQILKTLKGVHCPIPETKSRNWHFPMIKKNVWVKLDGIYTYNATTREKIDGARVQIPTAPNLDDVALFADVF